MTEITDLSTTDSSNTAVTGESIDGAIANMGRMDNTLQAILGLMARSIRTNVLRFLDNADPTKKIALDLSGLPTATERTWTAPYYSGTLGLVSNFIGYINGLGITTNAGDATNDLDFASGTAVDSTGAVSMLLASGLTKRLDAAWAVGTNQGMLATGAAVTNTTYHLFEIQRTDTKVVDIAADTSITGANIPANTNAAYTINRRIGYVVRSAGVNAPPVMVDRLPATELSGSTPVAACRGFVNFNGSTSAIRAQVNVSSITRQAAGKYTITFTNAFPDINYVVNGIAGTNAANPQLYVSGPDGDYAFSTTQFTINVRDSSGTATDAAYIMCTIFR